MDMKDAIKKVVSRCDLNKEEMTAIMHLIMTGNATPAQIGGFLVGLSIKGETVPEITAAATVMRELATGINISGLPHIVDIVGTGGDVTSTFNISTASMFLAAAAGCTVAKHGNRSVSSSSGSADVLETAGIRLDLTPQQVERCIKELGIGFMFAPTHHSAMRYAVGPRKELGIRTIFNILGPLTNPAQVSNQVLGVFSPDHLQPLAEVLQQLGSKHALVVHSQDGMDEISISADTNIAELRDGTIHNYSIKPETFGIQRVSQQTIQVKGPEESLETICAVLDNQPIPARDIVALNAGAAIYVSGVANSLENGYAQAQKTLQDGSARAKFEGLIALTQRLATANGT
ncbi:anthranilate phosphoribosyltransferase [Achromatium sp. WMS3]|nr:anthranilate phosphoribosyltransferase [Achromatium sp. WMS3]